MVVHVFNDQKKFSLGFFRFLKDNGFDLSDTRVWHYGKESAEFEKYLLLRWADLPDALPTLQAARLISVRPQRLYEQVRAGMLHSVTISGKQYCAKVEIIACAASPERLANARGKAYIALIEDYLNKKI